MLGCTLKGFGYETGIEVGLKSGTNVNEMSSRSWINLTMSGPSVR